MTAVLRAYRQAYAGLSREAWLLALAIFVNRCGTMVLPFLALYLDAERGLSAGGVGRVMAAYGCGAIAGTQLGGWLTQRWGGVRVATVGLALAAPGFAVIPACDSLVALVGVLLYLSLVGEAVRPAIATATTDFSPKESLPKAFALNRLALNLGMSIGPVLGGVLAEVDYRYLFWVNGVFAAATAGVLMRSFGWRARGVREEEQPESTDAAERGPWRDAPFLAFLSLQVLGGVVFFQMMSTAPLHWKQQWGITESGIGLLFVVNTLIIVALEMVLTDRLSQRDPLRMTAVGVGLICLGFGGMAFGTGFAYAAALVVVWTVGEVLHAPFSMAYVAARATGRRRGAYLGLNSASYAVASVVAPAAGLSLYEADPALPWWCCLALAVVLPMGFWRLSCRTPA